MTSFDTGLRTVRSDQPDRFANRLSRQRFWRKGARVGRVALGFRSALIAAFGLAFAAPAVAEDQPGWSLAIHGGAGVIERSSLSPEQDAAYRAALTRALQAGGAVLENGGSAMDAVQAAVEIMEDDPLFNAGRGAVFTAAGRNELDAAVMDGSNLSAGSVAGVTATRHPIAAARAVMERSPHVMMTGAGADAFAASVGLEQAPPSWFFTQRRWDQLVAALTERGDPIPPLPEGVETTPGAMAEAQPPLDERKFGTVGAVALDRQGRLAAGTSTGGMTAKRWGRVGDAPVIGAGTYASNADGCAVSATGSGEYFIRATVARDICARIANSTYDPGFNPCAGADICVSSVTRADVAAARAEIAEVGALGGDGGVIVMSADGQSVFAMNTEGMYRGRISASEPAAVAIYADEEPR